MKRRAALGALGLSALGGCGFELRRAPELRFRSVLLSGFKPKSTLERELRRQIDATPTTVVVDAPAQAQMVLEVITDTREKSVVATTAFGQVRELQLRSRFGFKLRTAQGREMIPATEILLSRDMSYSETAALAKEQEEEALYRSMQNDIAAQVLRRLASVPAP
ncbi:LPS assembly lipoprotein LptE [Piscinibacter sp.]|uniref:LPS-assembly lipoprotein LptE n=1 Tax=Piscinibacter sp. TaxID=1903157 RepID=UPI0039E6A4F9